MALGNCPNCGKRLRFFFRSQGQRLQCPACHHSFEVPAIAPDPAPPREAPPDAEQPRRSPTDHDDDVQPPGPTHANAGLGVRAKCGIAGIALAGIAFLVFLIYTIGTRPGRNPQPPHPTAKARGSNKEGNIPAPATRPAPAPRHPGPATTAPAREPLARKPVLSPEDLFARTSPAVVRVVVRDRSFKMIGQGSGFFVSSDGLLVTNYHVIEKAEFASILLSSNATLFVQGVAAVDPEWDLALLKVNGHGLPHIDVPPGQPPRVGAKVFAIGNPHGLTNTLSEGLVSGLRKDKGKLVAIQTTAAIGPGSSGGPLLTEDGKFVGVTTMGLRGGQNLNFAVPASKVREVIAKRGTLKKLSSAGGKRLDSSATAQLKRVWAAMAKRDFRSAAQILTRLKAEQNDNPFVWFALGYLHGELGSHDLAINAYKEAITLKPDFAIAYYNIGVAHANSGRYAEAIIAYKSAVALKPDDAKAYHGMGVAYAHCGRYAEAITRYKQAIALEPGNAAVHLNLGIANEMLNRYASAINAYDTAIRLDPGGDVGKKAQARRAILGRR